MTDPRPGLYLEPLSEGPGCNACDEWAQVRLIAWYDWGVAVDLCEGCRAEAVRLLEEAEKW